MGSVRPAIGFGRRLQRHGHVVIGCDFARVFAWGWRRIPLNTDRDSNSLPDASPGYAGTGAAGSTCPTSCSGCERQFRKYSAVGSTWPGDNPHSDDGAEYRMLNPGPVQIRAVSGTGTWRKNVRRGRERFVDVDCRKQYDARSVADLCHVRLGQWPELHQRHLDAFYIPVIWPTSMRWPSGSRI